MSELGSRPDFPGYQRSQNRLLQTRSLYRRTALAATDTTPLRGLAPLVSHPSSPLLRRARVAALARPSERRSRSHSSTSVTRADLHSRRRCRGRRSSKTLVARPARAPTLPREVLAQPQRRPPAPRPPVREMDAGPFGWRESRTSFHMNRHTAKASRNDAFQQQNPPGRCRARSVFVVRLRRRHAARTPMLAHPNRLAPTPPRYNVCSPRRLCGDPTANNDRRQHFSTALKARTTSEPTRDVEN
jgi:hypothetical protein